MELLEFMAKAKKKVYGKDFDPRSTVGDYKELPHSEGKWHFSHTYHIFTDKGLEHIKSQVRVSENGRLRWVMDTDSRITSKRISPEDIYEMLRYVVLDTDEARPFLLPKVSKHGDLVYMSSIVGDFKSFEGLENILWKGQSVYKGRIEGGLLFYDGGPRAHLR